MKKKSPVFQNVRHLTVAAMLTAISVVIGIFCKNFLNFGGGLFRITFENFPIILSGYCFGPVVGGMVGIATDLISYLLSNQVYPPNLIVTAGAFLIGFVSGLLFRVPMKSRTLRVIFSASVAHFTSVEMAQLTRQHNNANMLALGGRTTAPDLALEIVDTFLDTAFEGGRHKRRTDMLDEM